MFASLSIIIPTRNEEAYLPKLLESIKHQTIQPIEIIVADANSEDETRRIAREYGCIVVRGGNHPSIGRNNGAVAAKSQLLLFLDADSILPDRKFLEGALKEFSSKKLGVASCLAMITNGKLIDRYGIAFANFYFIVTEKLVKHGVGYCTFVDKKIHEQITGYDEKILIGEDIDYVTRASKFGEFRFLRSKKIVISLRRYEIEGRMKLLLKYVYTLVNLLFLVKRTNNNVPYTFNHNYSGKDTK